MTVLDRRSVLRAGVLAMSGGIVAACGAQDRTTYVTANSPEVRAAEAARRGGVVRDFALATVAGPMDLADHSQ